MMLRYILPIATGLFILVGCVTTRDLRELADVHERSVVGLVEAQEAYQHRVEEILADQSKTDAERLESLRSASEIRNSALEEVARVAGTSVAQLVQLIEARTEAALNGVGTVTGNPLIDLLVNTLLAAGLGAAGADKLRDRRRLVRGEPVGAGIPLNHSSSSSSSYHHSQS